jgi:hypothetical protein
MIVVRLRRGARRARTVAVGLVLAGLLVLGLSSAPAFAGAVKTGCDSVFDESGFFIFCGGTDPTPPAISSAVTGDLGNNGWYVGNVALTWTVADSESPGTLIKTGCVDQSITADQAATTYSCSASSLGGSAGPVNVTIKRDATAPIVAYSGNAATYTVDQSVSIACSTDDALSGVASDTCADVVGPAYSFPLGLNSFSATATDNAGNVGEESTSFTVAVTPSSLCLLTKQFVQGSAKYQALTPLSRAKIDLLVTALCQRLDALTATLTPTQRATLIAAYQRGVSALVPLGWLTSEQATILRNLASALP